MEVKRINEKIEYIKASMSPLSADVGIVKDGNNTFIYDVGRCRECIEYLNGLPGYKIVVISHFHGDHMENIYDIEFNELYVGRETYKHLDIERFVSGKVIIVEAKGKIELGNIVIKAISSTHSKGALVLSVDDEYTFVGDAFYPIYKGEEKMYNVTKLKEMICEVEAMDSTAFLLSHRKKYVFSKMTICKHLKSIYNRRKTNSPYIT